MPRKYRVYFKFINKNSYSKSIWFDSTHETTNFINFLMENVDYHPEFLRIMIEEKLGGS